MSENGVLAIFVKTPEFSKVKTRLAEGIGHQDSLQFYNYSLDATAALASQVKKELHNLDVVWAVAEVEGVTSDRWKTFGTIFQGEGDLGQRLHTVYEALLIRYDFVAFIGSDSPHISDIELTNALMLTKKWRNEKFIIGETYDGGFYFFGGGKRLPKEVWQSVEYSTQQTAQQLESQLKKFGGIEKVESNFDIDKKEDLQRLAKCTGCQLPEQIRIIEWARVIK